MELVPCGESALLSTLCSHANREALAGRCQLQKNLCGTRGPPKQHCLSACLLLASPTGDGGDGNSVAVALQGAGSEDFLKPIKQEALGACKEGQCFSAN